jgi:hypothetical protein
MYKDTDQTISNAWKSAIGHDERVQFDNLYALLSPYEFNRNLLEIAVMECNMPYEDVPLLMGEMFFQQTVYAAFSRLLMSCSGALLPQTYAADQDVSSSAYSTLQRGDTATRCQITMQPDSAVTLRQGKLDAFSMIEIKPKESGTCFDQSYRRDYDKCTLITGSTALMLKHCGMETKNITLPFLIGTGTSASLFVMCIEDDAPLIRYVGDSMLLNITGDNRESRSQMFVAFSVLLARFRQSFTKAAQTQMIKKYPRAIKEYSRAFSKHKTEDKPSETSSKTSRTSSKEGTGEELSGKSERLAQRAAEYQGVFANIQYPMLRVLKFEETSCSLQCQIESPFYFEGVHVASGQRVFLKET